MARARNIKPGIFKNEILGSADPIYTLLFQGLWTLADREGRLEDRPLRIKGELFPYRDGIDVDDALGWLHDNGFIIRYQAEGGRYVAVLNFLKHQKPHKHEQKSDIPAPTHGKSHGRRVRATTANGCRAPDHVPATTANGCSRPASSLIASSLNPESLLLDSLSSPEPASPDPGGHDEPDPSVMEFPCKGTGQKVWHLRASKVSEYRGSFPGVDLDAELRKARQWLLDRPTRQKTHDGMTKFIGGWLGRAQDTARPSARSDLRQQIIDNGNEFLRRTGGPQ